MGFILGRSIPNFVFAVLLQYIFAIKLQVLPIAKWDGFVYTILPTIALAMSPLADSARFIRTEMVEVLHSDYVELAKAKGLSRWEIAFKHGLRNSLIPLMTLLGPLAVALMTGSLVVENYETVADIPADEFLPLQKNTEEEREQITAPSLNFIQDSWRRLKKNKAAVISMVLLLVIILISVITIFVSPHDPTAQNVAYINLPPRIPGINIDGLNGKAMVGGELVDKYAQANVPSNVNFFLGTDGLGRDVLSRLFMGTRISLLIAFIAALLDVTIGVAYGLVSGLLGGRVDNVMQRFLEILSGIPNLVVMILMLVVFEPGIFSIVAAMAITNWIPMARIVRAQTMKLKDQEYVLAGLTLGESRMKIAFKHILPNISSVIIIQMMFSIPSAIFFEAFLSFIGLGLTPPSASLGTMLSEGYKTFLYLPYLLWIPAVTLSVIMIGFNLLADGLRDAFDPKMKE